MLPVELVYFRGENFEFENLLTWATASEINNSHFVVEHSIDGFSFSSIARRDMVSVLRPIGISL